MNATLVTAMNGVVDARVERIASIRLIVPQTVTVVLLVLCVLWAAVAGHAYGLKRNQKRAAWVQLDAGEQSMLDLQASMRSGAP